MTPSRRNLLSATAALAASGAAASGASAAARPAAPRADADETAWLQGVLERYAGLGIKASGGPGDTACGAWLEGELKGFGYACERQAFDAPFFEARTATLTAGSAKAEVIPQALVVATGPQGVTGPLRPAAGGGDLTGAIALISLPFKRWGALADPQVARPLQDALQRGAAGVVLVTNGPTGEAIALNVTTRRPGYPKPIAVLAPRDAGPFLAAAAKGETATLTLDGAGGKRPAFNLIARLDRKAAKTVIVTTPRSGWFTCAAERGSGLAVWLDLARKLPRDTRGVNLEFVVTSGHEYEYLGGEEYLEHHAPKPAVTKLWLHIGASAAARDWHDGPVLRPLPSADSQRILTATPNVIEGVRQAFRGVSGLEAAYVADSTTAGGELVNVLKAGYPEMIGEYGGHRWFHTRGDDLRCVSGDLVAPVAAAFHAAVLSALK